MRTRTIAIALALAGAAAAAGTALTQQAQNELTAIDTVAGSDQLNTAFGGAAMPSLASIAQDPTVDPGIRLRAIHAMTYFCPLRDPGTGQVVPDCETTDDAYVALRNNITAESSARSGVDLLVLRASIASYGSIGSHVPSTEFELIEGFLSHSSRDIRATTARALAELGDCHAVSALRLRYQQETTAQVRLAISDALRALASCP